MDTLRLLALGDSYTIGESVDPGERWPEVLIRKLLEEGYVQHAELDIIARTGWTTSDLLEGISEGLDAAQSFDLVSLLIGVNNQYQHLDFHLYEPEFRLLLDAAIKSAGGDTSNVIVISIPDYAYTPLFKGKENISEEIDLYNHVNRKVAAEYKIRYINVTGISRLGLDEEGYIAGDGLHPSAKQYNAWVELIIRSLFRPVDSDQ